VSQGPRRIQMHLRHILVTTIALAVTSIGIMAVGFITTLPWLATPFAGATQRPTPAESSLRDLIEALLPRAAGGGTVRLLPGQMPPDLPFEVPLPPGSRLVGTIIRTGDGRDTSTEMTIAQVATTEIAFDAPGSPEELLVFFDRALSAQGWHNIHYQDLNNGFLSNQAARSRSYCSDESDHAVGLTINPGQPGPNDVRLQVSQARTFSPCAEPWRSGGAAALSPGGGFTEPFPSLYAPTGARLGVGDRSSAYGGGGGQHQIAIEIPLSVADLAAHYGGQLETAGWKHQAGDAAPGFAWSTWRLPGEEEWQGLFFVSASAASNERWLYLRIEKGMPAPRGLHGQER